MTTSSRTKDRTGQRFGRLVVVGPGVKTWKSREAAWLCRCDCGNTKTVSSGNIGRRNKGVRSCGCLQRDAVTKHGLWLSGTFSSWGNARNRCRNPNNKDYPKYGERGITFDPLWDDFEVFLSTMGEKPDGWHLDRIDKYQGYGPGNCQWLSPSDHAKKTRDGR